MDLGRLRSSTRDTHLSSTSWDENSKCPKALDSKHFLAVTLVSFPAVPGLRSCGRGQNQKRGTRDQLLSLCSPAPWLRPISAGRVLWTQAEKAERSPGESVLAKPGLCQNSKHQRKASSLVSMTTCPPCPCSCSPPQALW